MWTDEDTEILQIANRIRQVICKADPSGYARLMDPKAATQRITTKVGDFELWLTWKGAVFVITRQGTGRSTEVFRCEPLQAKSRPGRRWNAQVVREQMVPALDKEMVLDDLSFLGRDL